MRSGQRLRNCQVGRFFGEVMKTALLFPIRLIAGVVAMIAMTALEIVGGWGEED